MITTVNIASSNSIISGVITLTVGAGGVPALADVFVSLGENSNSGTAAVTDSAGNVYATTSASNGPTIGGYLFREKTGLALSAGQTITITPSAGVTIAGANAFYVTGLDNGASTDAAQTATGTSANPSVTSGTPKYAGEFFVGVVVGATAITTFTQDSANAAWASPPGLVQSAAPVVAGGSVINAQNTALIYAPTFNQSDVWVAIIAAFPPASDPLWQGPRLPTALLAAWQALALAPGPILDSNAQPYAPTLRTPPVSGPSPQNPPFMGGSQVPLMERIWEAVQTPPLPGPFLGYQQPYTGRRLSPPISGPSPQSPPVIGSTIPTAVLVSLYARPAILVTIADAQVTQPAAAPSNPPINGGANVTLAEWLWIASQTPPLPGPSMNDQPYAPVVLVPPKSGPSPQNPPITGGAAIPDGVLNWYVPPPWPMTAAEQFYAPVTLTPPVAGATPQNPPITGGAKIGQPVLDWWIPPPWPPIMVEQPYAPIILVPVGGSVPADLPLMPVAVSVSWLPPPWPPIMAEQFYAPVVLVPPQSGPTISNPPFMGGAEVPLSVLVWDFPPPWPIWVAEQPYAPVELIPPISGPAPQNPPFAGASVSISILDWWVPPPLASQNPAPLTLGPAVAYVPPAASLTAFEVNWIPPPYQVEEFFVVIPQQPYPVPASMPPYEWWLVKWAGLSPQPLVQSGPTPQAPPISSVQIQIVMDSWVALPQSFIGPASSPQGGAYVPPIAATISWPVVAWQPPLPYALTASGPTPQNPPFAGGAIVRQEILIDWLPPPPGPYLQMEQPYTPYAGAPPSIAITNPPFVGGAKIPAGLLISWLPPAPQPPQSAPIPLPTTVVTAYLPPSSAPIIWPTPAQQQPPTSLLVIPAPVPASVGLIAILDWWVPQPPGQPQEAPTTPQAVVAQPPAQPYSVAIYEAWQAVPQPVIAVPTALPVVQPYTPPARWMMAWPPDAWTSQRFGVVTPSGPMPQPPPTRSLVDQVAISWLPDLSWSITLLARPSASIFLPFLGVDPRFITLPQPRVSATYGATRVYVTF